MATRNAKCSMSTILQKNTQSRCRAIRCGQSKHQAFLKEGWRGKRNETRKPFQIPSQLTPTARPNIDLMAVQTWLTRCGTVH